MKNIPTISIIGFGRFGKVLYKLLKDDFTITLFQRHPINNALLSKNTRVATSLTDVYSSDVIFFACPMESFEQVVMEQKEYFRNDQLLIDVLSVKSLPAKIFAKVLAGTKTRALLTHPMFGPESSRKGFTKLNIVVNQFSATKQEFNFWKNFFIMKELNVIEMSPKGHDKTIAHTQALTHFIGRLVDSMDIRSTSINTPTFTKLLEIRESICKDTEQLFRNMQTMNTHSGRMRKKLKIRFNKLFDSLENSSDTITKGEKHDKHK